MSRYCIIQGEYLGTEKRRAHKAMSELSEKILDRDNMNAAYRRVCANKGADGIDDVAVKKTYANLFFRLIAVRYERKSTIVTSNLPLSNWGEVFSDPVIASAIIDRLANHSSVVKINGRSYRLKGFVPDELSSLSPRYCSWRCDS